MYSVRNVAAVELVRCETTKVVRNLPDAHGAWQFWWRNANFRKGIQNVVTALYAVEIDGLSDVQLQALDEAIRAVLSLIDLHVSRLGSATHDTVDRQFFQDRTRELLTALEGLEQGLAPDPTKRPTREQLLDRFASMLGKPA